LHIAVRRDEGQDADCGRHVTRDPSRSTIKQLTLSCGGMCACSRQQRYRRNQKHQDNGPKRNGGSQPHGGRLVITCTSMRHASYEIRRASTDVLAAPRFPLTERGPAASSLVTAQPLRAVPHAGGVELCRENISSADALKLVHHRSRLGLLHKRGDGHPIGVVQAQDGR